ncbi:MAG: flagellar biosynthetic protein FliO [Chloroflexi bacterium]|nr:flagellar biosynthetic protein FliO [Chloroflexota bacterium]
MAGSRAPARKRPAWPTLALLGILPRGATWLLHGLVERPAEPPSARSALAQSASGDAPPPPIAGRAAGDTSLVPIAGRAAGEAQLAPIAGRAIGDAPPVPIAGRATGDAQPAPIVGRAADRSDPFEWPSAAVELILKLLVVLALIYVALAALRRYSLGIGLTRRAGHLEVIESTTLAPNRSVYLLRVGDRHLVVGVTPSQITTLATMDDPTTGPIVQSLPSVSQEALPPAVADWLRAGETPAPSDGKPSAPPFS